MSRLVGNTVLIVDADKDLGKKIQDILESRGAIVFMVDSVDFAISTLEEFEFDIIISSYYLPDGLIHHMIDWCRHNLDQLPIFVALGTSVPADDELLKRHLISGIFSKTTDPEKIVDSLNKFLFDFDQFYQRLLEMIEPRGVQLELMVEDKRWCVQPIEMTGNGIFVSVDKKFEMGTFGLLRVSVFEEDYLQNFTMVGSLDGIINGGQHFKINESYENTWNKLLNKLQEKQMSITRFLSKVADK